MYLSKESGVAFEGNTLSDVSFDKILKYAFSHSEDLKSPDFEESENVSSFLAFLRKFWTFLTDASLYGNLNGVGPAVVPFTHDDRTRELVANNFLKFLDNHREELSPVSRESENPTSALSNIAQGHLMTCFKLFTSFLLYNDGEVNGFSIFGVVDLVRVMMKLVPSAIDLSILLDFLTDQAKALSVENALVFTNFLVEESEYFSRNFGELEMLSGNKRIVQTCEAKLIGLVKHFENNFEQSVHELDYSSNVFHLRLLLNQCLPISHLGICNRQSVVTEPKQVTKVPLEEWTRLERATLRSKCEGLSDYEVASYESVASPASVKFAGNQIYDIKSYLAKSDKSGTTFVRSAKLPPYEVYSSFCDLYEFVQNPEVILSKKQDYVDSLQRNYSTVLAHVSTLAELQTVPGCGGKIGSFEFGGGVCEFVNKSSSLPFWSGFLLASVLSLQNLRLFHKKDEPTAYELLKDKCVVVLDGIDKDIWATISKIRDLSYLSRAMLKNERDWIHWKMNGCKFDLQKLTEDKIEMAMWDEDFEREDDEESVDDGNKILDTLRELEKISYEFGDENSTIGVNYVPVISNMELNQESVYWYINDPDQDVSKMTCEEQLALKFEDYCKKLEMDEDPENDIAEPEKSKHNPLFKFRFGRLFGLNHLEKFMEMSNDDIAAGGIESMLRVARGDKNEREESPDNEKEA